MKNLSPLASKVREETEVTEGGRDKSSDRSLGGTDRQTLAIQN